MNDYKSIFEKVHCKKKFDEPMASYTSFKIGGKADLVVFPATIEDLKETITIASKKKISFFIIGCGTNLLIRDDGIRGVVLSLTEGMSFTKMEIIKITNDAVHIVVGAGQKLSKAITYAVDHNLKGMEVLTDIPGSVGGALAMNAGTFAGEIKDIVKNVRIVDKDGNIKTIEADKIGFGYRTSNFPKGCTIIDAEFVLQKYDKNKINNAIENIRKRRRKAQNVTLPNAGSIFKNPEDIKAFEVIDSIGMRGAKAGGAEVSTQHCNYIVNKNNAKATDVITLINRIKKKAKDEKGITMKTEIKIVGEASTSRRAPSNGRA